MAENLLHFGAVTLRIQGAGSLLMSLLSLDDSQIKYLLPLTMSQTPGKEPTRLTNFTQQRARFKIETLAIDENFKVNRIVVFTKPIYTQYPGNE